MELKIKKIYDKNLKKDYQIIVPYELVNKKINDYISKVRPTFAMKGFRKGQVPVNIIREKYGMSIMADESDKILSDAIKNIVKNDNIKLALSPKADLKNFEEGKDIECLVTMELYPDVPQINVDKIKVTKRDVEFSEKEKAQFVSKLLKRYAKWNAQDASCKAKIGDSVNIDYVGKIDKKEFEGGTAKSYLLELGTKTFIDNFEEQLVGKKAGDQILVKVKFPKEYHSADYAGKAAEFDVKINEVLVAEIPELTEEFVKENFKSESKEKFEENIQKQHETHYESIARSVFKKELFDFLNKKHDFDLPEGLIENHVKEAFEQIEKEATANPEKFKNDKEKNKEKDKKREDAKRTLRCGMILTEFAKDKKIEVTQDEINQEISKVIRMFPGQEQQAFDHYNKNPEAVQHIAGVILEEKIIDFILNNSQVERKKISTEKLDDLWKEINQE